jgi:hypothetical protein
MPTKRQRADLKRISECGLDESGMFAAVCVKEWCALDVESGAFMFRTNGRGKAGLLKFILILPAQTPAERGGLFESYTWNSSDRKFIRAWSEAEAIKAEGKEETADIAYLKSLGYQRLNKELKTWGLLRLRAIARALNVEPDVCARMQSKGVLVLDIGRAIRRAKIEDEPPERNGCGICFCCKSNNRYGCSRNGSLTDAVMADVRAMEAR